MTLADHARVKQIEAKLEDALRRIDDLTRRLDDFSKAERARETLRLKKQSNG